MTEPARKRKLTSRQQRFVEEYLVDLSATQAAIRAGYSPQTAEQISYQLLQKTSVSLAVQEGLPGPLPLTHGLPRRWQIDSL